MQVEGASYWTRQHRAIDSAPRPARRLIARYGTADADADADAEKTSTSSAASDCCGKEKENR